MQLIRCIQSMGRDESARSRPSRPSIGRGDSRDARLVGLRVLVVEDDDDARDLLVEVLQRCGCVVTEASSAGQALDCLARSLPHLILSDIAMPDVDGYALMEAIRALPPERGGQIPSVAITAFTLPKDEARGRTAGFNAHLGKPLVFQRLVDTIVRLLPPDRGNGLS